MTTNRKILRQALRDMLKKEVVSAQEVYAYQAGRLLGQSPVVVVTSAGSERERLSFHGARLTASLDVHTFVLHGTADGTWTEEDAENTLDDLEYEIAAACEKNPLRVGKWGRLVYGGSTNARDLLKIEGVDYLHETITVEMQEYV